MGKDRCTGCDLQLDDFQIRGADKSLARPGRKQATATKLLQATQKKIRSLSVQPGLRGSNDLRVGRKMATFQLFFFSRVGLRTYQHPCTSKKRHCHVNLFHTEDSGENCETSNYTECNRSTCWGEREITNTLRQHELFYQTPRHVIQDNEIAMWQICWVNNLKGKHTARINVSR